MFITKQQKVALKTMAIKAKVYNFIRKSLYKKDINAISDLDFINNLFKLTQEANIDLYEFKRKRKKKAKIQKERAERGYKPKIKTSKAEWENIKNFGNYPDGSPYPKDPIHEMIKNAEMESFIQNGVIPAGEHHIEFKSPVTDKEPDWK